MSIKAFILGAATLASVALPGVASAQRYGGYGYGNGGYYGRGYDRDDRRDYRDNRHDDRHRWEQRRRWKERERRREWAHGRRYHDRYDRGYYGY